MKNVNLILAGLAEDIVADKSLGLDVVIVIGAAMDGTRSICSGGVAGVAAQDKAIIDEILRRAIGRVIPAPAKQ